MRLATQILILSLFASGAAMADGDDHQGKERERRGPPQVAVEACASSVQGDPCSFEGRGGEQREGSCFAPDDKPLACKPTDMPPHLDRERQEAL